MTSHAVNIAISIALVTRNRPKYLILFMESIKRQNVQPYEIIISDDSDSNQSEQIKIIAERFSAKYVRGPQRGLYANRNRAALACGGTHILSADDDHTHPPGFMARVLQLATDDPTRIWVLSERDPKRPNQQHTCPAELRPNGTVGAPLDESDCRAIADGASVYPIEVFVQGHRYDERYKFGQLWYLWGIHLSHHGWRITYDSSTFVWHDINSSADRSFDRSSLRSQLACASYVSLSHAIWLEPTLICLSRAFFHLIRRVVVADTIEGYQCRARINLHDLIYLVRMLSDARKSYTRHFTARRNQSRFSN
jgi:glycosyltransferase involved in cell wall biosynthesis